jgi:hypothetical protein
MRPLSWNWFAFDHRPLPRVAPSFACSAIDAQLSLLASSPLYYITALTSLFEGIAMIVDQHQPVVEKYYGPGKMKNVVRRLLEESDRVTKTLKEGWEEDRAMQRKVCL